MKRKIKEALYRFLVGLIIIGLIFGCTALAVVYIISGLLSLIFGGLL